MSQGDNLTGIKTIYKGIEMRSKLESKVAFFLDRLNIKWTYEPKTFLLSCGIPYKPDFYLPELKLWVEVKGVIKEHNKEISKYFVKDNNTTLLMIAPKMMLWVDNWEEGTISLSAGTSPEKTYVDRDVQLGKCSQCKKYFFCGGIGSWHCRNCSYWDGDHLIVANLLNSQDIDNVGKLCGDLDWQSSLDVSDIESIKWWTERLR